MKILITGFGPFLTNKANFTGWLLQNLADEKIFHPNANLKLLSVPGNLKLNPESPFAPLIKKRKFKFDDIACDMTLVTTAVQWKLSADQVLTELQDDNYDFVLMLGIAKEYFIFETGAKNQTSTLSGFDLHGNPDKRLPEEKIIPSLPMGYEYNFSWPQKNIQNELETLILTNGFQIQKTISARDDNRYICNDVSFRVLHFLQSQKTKPVTGFLHFPNNVNFDHKNLSFSTLLISEVIRICQRSRQASPFESFE